MKQHRPQHLSDRQMRYVWAAARELLDLPAWIAPKAVCTVTILHNAPNATGAEQFVSFLLGDEGHGVMLEQGVYLQYFQISGDQGAVPLATRSLP